MIDEFIFMIEREKNLVRIIEIILEFLFDLLDCSDSIDL